MSSSSSSPSESQGLSEFLGSRRRNLLIQNSKSSCPSSKFRLPACVTFCGIQVEIEEGHPDLDIYFNRGKSLEDLFQNLTLVRPTPPKSKEEAMERKQKKRGRREAGVIKVETFTDFEDHEERGEKPKSDETSSDLKKSTPSGSRGSSKEPSPPSVSGSSADQINFVSGNPFVEITKGVLHLYKENQVTSLDEGIIRTQMMCMLGVPAKIKTPDLLQFTAPCHSRLEMMRIIQDSSPNQYMVLFKFKCQESADEFYEAFNGQKFNSFEDDVCSLVYISKVETCKESEYYPFGGHTELPTCSICLERMDESIATVLTILCNHTFHGSCLAQWEDSTCPVCRCLQTPEVVAEQRCSDCQSSEDLWMCLICGYVGCGRYIGGHSHAHFKETQHCYTIELGQSRVWDYVGDNFVHRIIQSDSADGKLVETQGNGYMSTEERKCVDGVNVNSEEKLDSIQLEYTYLLTSQLEAQRRFFEEKISRMEEQNHRETEEMQLRLRNSVEEFKHTEENLKSIMSQKQKNEQKYSHLSEKIAKLNADLMEERQLNESLTKNQREWQVKFDVSEAKRKVMEEKSSKEIDDLKEQLRDLTFYLEAQQTIANSPMREEIKDGNMKVGAAAQTPKDKIKSKRKK